MPRFKEDDEIEQAKDIASEAERQMVDIEREMAFARDRRDKALAFIESKTIDPLVEKALDLAQNLGHALGANEALGNKVKHMESRISVRDTEISKLQAEVDEHSDYDEWQESSAEWERKYKNLVKSRRSR